MGRTYKAVGPNPDYNHIPAGRMVRESNARRFFKAVKKLAHHRDRREAAHYIREAI